MHCHRSATLAFSPRHEYGPAALTLELVDSMDDAIDHLHANGSGHCHTWDCLMIHHSSHVFVFWLMG